MAQRIISPLSLFVLCTTFAAAQNTYLIEADHGQVRAAVARVGGVLRMHPDVHRYEIVTLTDAQKSDLLSRLPKARILIAPDAVVLGQRLIECPLPDSPTAHGKSKEIVSINTNTGWNGVDHNSPASITYSFGLLHSPVSWPEDINKAQLVAGLNIWAQYAQLTFTETTNRSAARSIDFYFPADSVHLGHYDANGHVCDPPGSFSGAAHSMGTGHTDDGTYWPQAEPTAGDVHISDVTPWINYDVSKMRWIGVHEGGHSLGLPHSDDPTSVMNTLGNTTGLPNATDIAWIQALYAPRGTPPPPPPNIPVITTFSASPTGSTPGAPVTLSWFVAGATSVVVDNGVGSVGLGGSISVYPQATTTYTLTAMNASGSVTSEATVTITGPPPTITTFTATPNSVYPLFGSLANWSVAGATSVSISPGVGTVGSAGTMYLYPQQTTTYTLTATNANGTATSTATVTVLQQPCQGRGCSGGGSGGTLALAVTSSTDYSCCGSVEATNPLLGAISGGTPPYVALAWAHNTMYGYSGACSINADATFSCSGIPLNAGSNSVTLTGTDSAGGSASTTVTITGRQSR